MKASVYIETTIPSYYTSLPSRDVVIAGHQATTRDWWERRLPHFRPFVSQVVLDEAASGNVVFARRRLEVLAPFPILELRDDVIELANAFINGVPLPKKAARASFLTGAAGWQFGQWMSYRIGARLCSANVITCLITIRAFTKWGLNTPRR